MNTNNSQTFDFLEQRKFDTYIHVILPLALPKTYTYAVPVDLKHKLQIGVRVEVQFGKHKLYAGLVVEITNTPPKEYHPKPIISILDDVPIVTPTQFNFWKWISNYYCCTLGETMFAALPNGLKLSSETKLILSSVFDGNYETLNDKEYLIAEALSIQGEITIDEVRKIINQKTVYGLIHSLLDKKVLYLKEELVAKYKPKLIVCVRLQEPYHSNPETLKQAFDKISNNATRQMEALMGFMQMSKTTKHVVRKDLCDKANVNPSVIKTLVGKGIFELYEREVSRLQEYEEALISSFPLSKQQTEALKNIDTTFKEKDVVLLHGVTGSGKTRVYVDLIQKAIDNGEQVLYLLPEIALTTQIVGRLQRVFGDSIAVYHSKIKDAERVEVWNSILGGKSVVLAARSGMFLPFRNLKLIIVDEEHDPSFKQTNPSPRYNARDMAVVLAHLHGAKVLLGTATPSIETYHNVTSGKYGLVNMKERFGGLQLPEIVIADAKAETQNKSMQSHFTTLLLNELKAALARGEQAILFQNRRGYAPRLQCGTCGWSAECVNCDITITYHKHQNNLCCHLCGYKTKIPKDCPACGSARLSIKGFGTEKIEDELKIYLPDARIARMDWDTVRSKNAHAKIIQKFESKAIDILVGTQMVTKGLDFDNVGIVGVLSADHLLYFPDFRATERAFQLMTQVSGRAGRKKKRGKVIIQAFNTVHPVLKEVIENDFQSSFKREIEERQEFYYPPFYRLIKITIKHKKPEMLGKASKLFADILKHSLGKRVLGPTIPNIGRVRNYYIADIIVKLERKASLLKGTKTLLLEAANSVKREKGMSSVRVNIDVDPY